MSLYKSGVVIDGGRGGDGLSGKRFGLLFCSLVLFRELVIAHSLQLVKDVIALSFFGGYFFHVGKERPLDTVDKL